MKQVFQNHSQVCHAFNLQNQERGRSGNIFFEGNKIYSYGYHYLLGEFIDPTTILINNKGYSQSTSKHIAILTDATRDKRQVFISHIEINLVLAQLEKLYNSLMKARKPSFYKNSIDHIYSCFVNEVTFLGGFYQEHKYLRGFEFIAYSQMTKGDKQKYSRINEIRNLANEYSLTEKYLKKVERAKELELIKAEKEKEEREKRAAELERTKAERIEKFYSHEVSNVIGLAFDLLRVSKCGEYVETSQAVRIPKKEAQRYFNLFQKGLDLRGLKIGEFTTLSNSLGLLKIGCHNITHDEVNRVGQLINA